MGTKANFYVGMGPQAEWLGYLQCDGGPDQSHIAKHFKKLPKTARGYRSKVSRILKDQKSWGASCETPETSADNLWSTYEYTFHDNQVMVNAFYRQWETLEHHNSHEYNQNWLDLPRKDIKGRNP